MDRREKEIVDGWKEWEEKMGQVYLDNDISRVCSAMDCTGLIPAGHEEWEIYELYEELYPYLGSD